MTEIREIRQEDNAALAQIIRAVLTEFGANKPGTVYYDPTTDALYELFRTPGSIYYVLLLNGELMGGCGIFPTSGLPDGCCELVKLYLLPQARGKSLGKKLITVCSAWAKEQGYNAVYLETLPELTNAVGLYEHCGFVYLQAPLGNSGHFGCDLWMLKDL